MLRRLLSTACLKSDILEESAFFLHVIWEGSDRVRGHVTLCCHERPLASGPVGQLQRQRGGRARAHLGSATVCLRPRRVIGL